MEEQFIPGDIIKAKFVWKIARLSSIFKLCFMNRFLMETLKNYIFLSLMMNWELFLLSTESQVTIFYSLRIHNFANFRGTDDSIQLGRNDMCEDWIKRKEKSSKTKSLIILFSASMKYILFFNYLHYINHIQIYKYSYHHLHYLGVKWSINSENDTLLFF